MSSKFLAAFSNNERYFAHVTDGGKLRIWDVNSLTLKNEYTPDVHLISPFTDLRWISTSKKIKVGSGSRKRSLKNESTDLENEYLLLGSRSSKIYLFSVSSCSIVNTFENGHSSRINSVAWCRNIPGVFYTCSDDPDIIQWDLQKCSVKKKWRCGTKISCLAVADDGESVIAAKREIQWWTLSDEKKNVVKTFIGHSTDVQFLVFVRICGEACVLSAAAENRLVHAWLLSTENADRGALATFAVDDALMSLTVKSLSNGGVNVLASSRTGILHLFQCTKNGKKHVEPIKSKLIVQIGAVPDQEGKSQGDQLPIIGAAFTDENSAYIAYGSDILSFENLDLETSQKSSKKSPCMFILREDPRKKSLAHKEEALNKILPTSTSKNVHYVPPEAVNGYVVPNSSKKLGKRNNAGEKNIDVPLERRLDNLIVDVPSATSAPDSDSLVHLLLQALKSKDSRLLIDIIENKDENVIKSTVNRLPVDVVVPFSAELISLLQGKRSDSNSAVKWLQYIITAHAAQLISNPDVIEIFAPIFPFIESRLNVVGPLYRLVGRLDMMVKQIEIQDSKSEQMLQNINLQPKYIYQDEDSDEEEDEEEEGNEVRKEDTSSNEDSDDHWDEMSEVDMDSGQEQTLDIEMDDAEL